MVGTPSTVRPMGCHWPSPGVGSDTNGTMAAGAGRWAGPVATGNVVVDATGSGMAPAAGLPPLGGACHEYQVSSAHVTMPPPPWSRTHSVSRPPTVGPSAGLVAAVASDAHTGVSRTSTTSRTVVFGWRPTTVDRSRRFWLAQRPPLAPGRARQPVEVARRYRRLAAGRRVDHGQTRRPVVRAVLVVGGGVGHAAAGASQFVVGRPRRAAVRRRNPHHVRTSTVTVRPTPRHLRGRVGGGRGAPHGLTEYRR